MKHRLALATLLAALGCSNETPPEPAVHAASPLPAPAPSAAPATPPGAARTGGLTWTDPPAWPREAPRSSMRVATYRVPRAEGDTDDAELAVFYFGPGGAGGIDANVQRWTKQFKDVDAASVKRSDRTISGLAHHVVEVERGTYESGMPGVSPVPREGYGMIAVIVEAPTGPYFFKLTGPAKTVAAARETLLQVLESARPAP
jgi:hypothetical protein